MSVELIGFILLLWQIAIGYPVLTFFKRKLGFWINISLSIMIGVFVMALVPFLMQLAYIHLGKTELLIGIALATIIIWAIALVKFKWAGFKNITSKWEWPKIYEIPILVYCTYALWPSFWKNSHIIGNARDYISGAEGIAKFAFQEGSLINSFFTVNLETTNCQYKSPFITTLQLLYKHLGVDVGQIWQAGLVLAILLFLYQVIKTRTHAVIASFFILVYISIPELYAYIILVLYDYPSAIYYAPGIYFLHRYMMDKGRADLYLASLFLAISTYVRTETLVFIGFSLLPLIWYFLRSKEKDWKGLFREGALLMLPSIFAYILLIPIYNGLYLPETYSIGNLFNDNLADLSFLSDRLGDILSRLLVGEVGSRYWGYYFYLLFIVAVIDIIMLRGFKKKQSSFLFLTFILIFCFAFFAYLFPLFDLMHSTKRAMFKVILVGMIYFSISPSMKWLAAKLSKID